MPDQIAEKNESNQYVRPKTGYERQFKTALSDFVELSRQLLALDKISGVVPVIDRFVDNNTVLCSISLYSCAELFRFFAA